MARTAPPPPFLAFQSGWKEKKIRISDKNCASPGKLNKVFMRKRGVPKARHLTSGWVMKGLATSQRCRQNARGWGQPLVSGSFVRAYVKSICHVSAGSQTHISFPKKKKKKAPGTGSAKGNVSMTRMKWTSIGVFFLLLRLTISIE